MSRIVAASSCFPPYYYPQEEITRALERMLPLNEEQAFRLRKFHQSTGVEGRHLAVSLEELERMDGFGERNDRWISVAEDLGEAVVADLLEKSGLEAREISALAFTTVTGIAAPSMEARLMNRLPFSRHLKRMPFFGWGCMGGAVGIARMGDYLTGHPQEAAILLSVELCSLTIQRQDTTPANLVSSGLFGDGAAAVLMVGNQHPLARNGYPRIIDTLSVFFSDTGETMGWEVEDTGFRIVLSPEVADVAGSRVVPEIVAFLAGHGLKTSEIGRWIVHHGGPKVIQALEDGLGLEDEALQLTRESLARVGNVSSTSVLLILEETLRRFHTPPGTYGLLMAMGPGFSAELVLLQW